MTWYWGILLAIGGFALGTGLTRWLMKPQFCPRCGAYMKGRAREVADWLRGHKKDSGEGKGEGNNN